jgi:glycosyltransferase domain-containing protein
MPAKLSVVIPTYNRPQFLRRALRFLRTDGRIPIIVADGSLPDAAETNAATCKGMGGNVPYFHLPSSAGSAAQINNVIQRLSMALSMVKTPYVVFCADDDLLMMESALACVEFLENNGDYVGCQGFTVGFREESGVLKVEHLEYRDLSIDGVDVGTRLMQLFSRYESPFYSVVRTPIQSQVFEKGMVPISGAFFELFHSTAIVMAGKIKRIGGLHYLRDVTTTTASATPVADRGAVPTGNFMQWVANDLDDLFSVYKEHRRRVIALAADGGTGLDPEALKRCIDTTFLVYLGRQLRLTSWIDEYITRNVPSIPDGVALRERFYRNFDVARPDAPSQIRRRLARMVEDPSGAIRSLKSRLLGTRYATPAGDNGARLVVNAALLSLFPKETWTSLLRRLECAAP